MRRAKFNLSEFKPRRSARLISGAAFSASILSYVGVASAQSNWINPAGGSWENAANWNGGVPQGLAVFNLSTGSPYVVMMGSTEGDGVNVLNSQVAIQAATGKQLVSGATINVNASAGQVASFSFTGTSIDGTDGSTIYMQNGTFNNKPGSVGSAGSTFFTLNDTSFTSVGDPYIFGRGSTVSVTNSAISSELEISGTANFNASSLSPYYTNEMSFDIGIAGVTGPASPAVLNLKNGSTLALGNDDLAIGSIGYSAQIKGDGVVNLDASQITSGYILGVGGLGGNGTLNITDGAKAAVAIVAISYQVYTFAFPGTGVMTVAGTGSKVSASQAIAVGATGTLQISSSGLVTTAALNLSTGSTLMLSLDADGIQVSGLALLAGTLDVTLGSTADPTLGQSFDLLSFGSESGSFSSINLPPLDAGLGWSTQQLYTDGTISVIAVPEPVGLSLLTIGSIALLSRRKKI